MLTMLCEGEAATGGMGILQWVLIGVIALMLIGYPILASRRTKRENETLKERINSLKKGDEILTNTGIYGKILEIKQDGDSKRIVIETGSDKNKSYLTVDAYSVYTVLNDTNIPAEAKEQPEQKKVEEKKEQPKKETKPKTATKKSKSSKK